MGATTSNLTTTTAASAAPPPPLSVRYAPAAPTPTYTHRDVEHPTTFATHGSLPKQLDPKSFNSMPADRAPKHVAPQVVKTNYSRQPSQRPTKYYPNAAITKADVDVLYDQYAWSAVNGCFNEQGVHPVSIYPIGEEVDVVLQQ